MVVFNIFTKDSARGVELPFKRLVPLSISDTSSRLMLYLKIVKAKKRCHFPVSKVMLFFFFFLTGLGPDYE